MAWTAVVTKVRETAARVDLPTPVRALLAVLVVVLALVTGVLRAVVVHAFAWPALFGGWIAEMLGAEAGGTAHTLARWILQAPWTVALVAVAVSISLQWRRELLHARAVAAFEAEHGAELEALQARIDAAPGLLDAIEAEARRIDATLEALGSDAWAAGAVVTSVPARLLVARTGEVPGTLGEPEPAHAGEVRVRARDITFHAPGTAVQWVHPLLGHRRNEDRLILGVTGSTGVSGIPVGLAALGLSLDHLELVLDLANGDADTFATRQRLIALRQRSAVEVDRVLDAGEVDLDRLAQLTSLRPGTADGTPPSRSSTGSPAAVPADPPADPPAGPRAVPASSDVPSDVPAPSDGAPAVVWGRGAERAARACFAEIGSWLDEGEQVEFVLRVRRRRPDIDLVVATDRRVIGLLRARPGSGPVVRVMRSAVTDVAVTGTMHRLSLTLDDGRLLDLGVLGHTADMVPALHHLRGPAPAPEADEHLTGVLA